MAWESHNNNMLLVPGQNSTPIDAQIDSSQYSFCQGQVFLRLQSSREVRVKSGVRLSGVVLFHNAGITEMIPDISHRPGL